MDTTWLECSECNGRFEVSNAIAEAMRQSGARRKIRHYRPKRPLMSRLGVGRASWHWAGVNVVTGLLAGGIYFIEPGFLGAGWVENDW